MTMTLPKSYTQFPKGISKERSPGDSQRACRRDVAEGTKVPHDGPAEVPVRLDAGRHNPSMKLCAGQALTHHSSVVGRNERPFA
jgi:hypothetical protein